MFESVLIVCTGNICRSPMAEYMLRERWQRAECVVGSAGTAALINHPADADATAVCLAYGIDMAAHRARQASNGLVRAHDLILTMEPHHERWLLGHFPTARGRVYPITHWLDEVPPVPDPYCQGREAFELTWQRLEPAIETWVERLS